MNVEDVEFVKWTNGFSDFARACEQVVNTTSTELSNVAIEASVWDLEGTCPYYKVLEKLTVPSKRTLPIFEMKYPKSEVAKPVYFLLLKLYRVSDYGILSRNFYWLYLTGGDYKLLESYRKRKVPLKITSEVSMKGSRYEIQMQVQNTAKKPGSVSLLDKNKFISKTSNGDSDASSSMESVYGGGGDQKNQMTIYQKIQRKLSSAKSGFRVTDMNGNDAGVAFFLHFSVHGAKKDQKKGEDTRILPVHYSNNYISLVPGEEMVITMSFDVPEGTTPQVNLHGWNYESVHDTLQVNVK